MDYSGKYVIIGPPGTGKTYRIAQSVAKICKEHPPHDDNLPAAVCSLTRAAATEAAGRIATLPREAVGTLHALAFRALGYPTTTAGHIGGWNEAHPDLAFPVHKRSVDDPWGDQSNGKQGKSVSRETEETSMSYHRLRAIRLDPHKTGSTKVRRFAAEWEDWKQQTGYLDFTDLIEQALLTTYSAPGHPSVILADEAQDHSRLELALLARWGESADATILVGDPWQSLYDWRGAAPELLLDPEVPESHRDVLGQSWRVPRAVHEAAVNLMRSNLSTYAPIDYQPRDHDGAVEPVRGNWASPDPILDLACHHADDGRRVMVMGACGFMLDAVVTGLKNRGTPFCNPWRRTNGRWNPFGAHGVTMRDRLAAFLTPITRRGWRDHAEADTEAFEFGANVPKARKVWSRADFAAWVDLLQADRCLLRGAKTTVKDAAKENPDGQVWPATLKEVFKPAVAESLATVNQWSESDAAQWLYMHTLPAARPRLEFAVQVAQKHGASTLYKKPLIYVGTIHSFKGSEADVVIIFPDLSPKGYRQWMTPGGQDSILRMFYVALTRARETVYFANPKGGLSINLRGACNGESITPGGRDAP